MSEKHLTETEIEVFFEKIKKYPHLNRLFTQKKLKGGLRRYYRGDEFSIFSILLSNQTYWHYFLNKLDSLVTTHLYTDKRKRNNIFDNVFNFLTELEFGQRVIDAGLLPETDVKFYNKKDIDYKLPSGLYIEITTPKRNQNDKKTWMKEACAVPLNFWVEDTILRKIFDEQEINYAVRAGVTNPILILLNGDYRGIDELNVLASIRNMQADYSDEFSTVSGILLYRNTRLILFENLASQNRLTKENYDELTIIGVKLYRYAEEFATDVFHNRVSQEK